MGKKKIAGRNKMKPFIMSSTTTTSCQPDTLLTSQSTRKSSTKTASRTPPKNHPPRPTSKPPSKTDTRPAKTNGSSRNSDSKKYSQQKFLVLMVLKFNSVL